jgi:hypothetical protein
MINRREDFSDLNPDSSLYDGLLFAGLGQIPGGNNYFDSSINTNKNEGTLYGMTLGKDWIFDGEIGRHCTNHDGVDDIIVTNSVINHGITNKDWTFSAWVNCGSPSGGKSFCIWSNGSSAAPGCYAYLDSVAPYIGMYWGGWLGFNSRVSIDFWNNIVFLRSSGTLRCYLDGRKDSLEYSYTGVMSDSIWRFCGSGISSDHYLYGKLADPMIWNRALSEEEIKILSDRSDTTYSGLILPQRIHSSAKAASNRRQLMMCS